MFWRWLSVAAATVAIGAGGGGMELAQAIVASAAAQQIVDSGNCPILTAADVKAVTGVAVRPVRRLSRPGAGGTCGNYAAPSGELYVGVNVLRTAARYNMVKNAVSEIAYPEKRVISGVGDDAVLFKSEENFYLVARKGERGLVLFGRTGPGFPSDDQLRRLAIRALGAR